MQISVVRDSGTALGIVEYLLLERRVLSEDVEGQRMRP